MIKQDLKPKSVTSAEQEQDGKVNILAWTSNYKRNNHFLLNKARYTYHHIDQKKLCR